MLSEPGVTPVYGSGILEKLRSPSYKNQQEAEKREQQERDKADKALRARIKEEVQEERVLKALDDAADLHCFRPFAASAVATCEAPATSEALQGNSRANPKVPQLPLQVRRSDEEFKVVVERLPEAEEAVRRMKQLHEQLQQSMQKLRLMEDEFETRDMIRSSSFVRLADMSQNQTWEEWLDAAGAPTRLLTRPPLPSISRDPSQALTADAQNYAPLPLVAEEIQVI
jgi:hypothetical protein